MTKDSNIAYLKSFAFMSSMNSTEFYIETVVGKLHILQKRKIYQETQIAGNALVSGVRWLSQGWFLFAYRLDFFCFVSHAVFDRRGCIK